MKAKPWYREPWPWILASGPAIAVVAGLYTYKLAVSSSDGLVADDYYVEGLAVGKTIAQGETAQKMGLNAHVRVGADSISIRLTGLAGFAEPASLRVAIEHPTKAGMDQTIELLPSGDAYVAPLRLPAAGHWLILIEDAGKTWRLLGNVMLPSADEVTIGTADGETRQGT